jgi:signal transduction histidine kinase
MKFITTLAVPAVFFLVSIITNPYHHLFYSHFDFWGDSFGPLFYCHQAYNYALILAGIILCSRNFTKQFGEKRMQAVLFAIAIIIPIVANMLYIFKWFELVFGFAPYFDITPIACNISLMLFALATFKYRFFDDVKIARRNALALIPEGILLIDANGRISDFNDTFKKMYENGDLYSPGEQSIIKRLPCKESLALYEKANFILDCNQPSDTSYFTVNGRYCRAICQPITISGKASGAFLRFIDITQNQSILSEVANRNNVLVETNKKLEEQAATARNFAVVRTRNFIAGEVHDILGHSVVLAISLLEIARLSLGKAAFDFIKCISHAETLLKGCLKGIESSVSGQVDSKDYKHSLIDSINKLIEDIKSASITIELTVQGIIPQLPGQYHDTIFKLCREAITNAVRHGKADKINIILRFLPEDIEIFIIDNGIGCKQVNKGMGITGMEKRLQALDGLLMYSSISDQGFCVQALLPAI